jgi:hypothetical protein
MWVFLKAQMGLDPDDRGSGGVPPGESEGGLSD